jgi:hypothetical protein
MAKIGNAVYYGGAGKLEIGTSTTRDEYTAAVTSCAVVPSVPKGQVTDIGGGVQAYVGTPAWVAEIEYNQDWKTPQSLAQQLVAWHGQVKSFKYTPANGGAIATFDALVEIGRMGGSGSALHNATISLQINGQPAFASA